ncbi:MAG: hypothetical protein GXP24_10125 [Planctomycetes bacterium]|nr:hypothetical protein [Planctomycetota bacterium]
MKLYHATLAVFLSTVVISHTRAEVVIVAVETEDSVVLAGSGSFNLSALSNGFLASNGKGIRTGISGATPDVRVGPPHGPFSGPNYDPYMGDSLSTPEGFGPPPSFPAEDVVLGLLPGFHIAESGTGDLFGAAYFYIDDGGTLVPLVPALIVPAFYTSGTELAGTAIFSGETFDSLGIIPGSYTWTWGSGATFDSFTLLIVPEPSSILLALSAIFAPFVCRSRLFC